MKLDIEDAPHDDTKRCCRCGIELTEKNISAWSPFIDKAGTTANQCVFCQEISVRELNSCIVKDDVFIPQKTRKKITKELFDEGWTEDTLKLKEEQEFSECH
jgi:hypothetical protein